MKEIIVKIGLMLAYILLIATIVLSFIAGLKAEKAKAFENNYQWSEADKIYKTAIKIGPFNSEYIIEYGDFILHKTFHHKESIAELGKAEAMYKRAIKLNPMDTKIFLSLGNLEIEIYKNKTIKDKCRIKQAIDYFKKAAENDPNGFNTLYFIGSTGINLWNILDDDSRRFIVNVLQHSFILNQRESFHEYIYSKIWHTENNFKILMTITPNNFLANKYLYQFIKKMELWQFRKEQADRVNYYRQIEEPEEFARDIEERARLLCSLRSLAMTEGLEQWTGTSESGRNQYENGKMYWTGTVDAGVILPAGNALIKIKARSSHAEDIWPYMIVELDGEVIGETFVDSPEWKLYDFEVYSDGGVKVLSVTFPNDKVVTRQGVREDRNLYLGEVVVTRK